MMTERRILRKSSQFVIMKSMPMLNRQVMVALAIAFLFIGGAWFISSVSEVTRTGEQIPERVAIAERGAPSLGRNDASVTIIEFADFQCPSCAVFHFGAGEVIFEQYVKTGLARFVFKQYPLLGEESFSAAYASACAGEKGKFWEYHDVLFARQVQSEGENSGIFSFANLVRIAEEIGLETVSFSDCLRTEKYRGNIMQEIEDAKRAGVTGTPAVFINGKKFEGALPFESYKATIEEELAK